MIEQSKRVYVYRNLHRNCFSVRQSGKVIEHTNLIMLKNCRFLVSGAGRKRVLSEQRKNVHAGISGYVVSQVPNVPEDCCYVSYNPYDNKSFVTEDGESISWSDYAILNNGKVEAIWE